jgi:hypothetical protein
MLCRLIASWCFPLTRVPSQPRRDQLSPRTTPRPRNLPILPIHAYLVLRKRSKVVLTPLALDERQRTRQGIVWLLKASERGRKSGVPREQRVAREVLAILEGNSDVFKWLEERHKVGMANR